jgi:diaminopimelate decarboxylase
MVATSSPAFPTETYNSPDTSGQRYIITSDRPLSERSPNQELLPISARVNERDHLEIGGCDVVELVERFGSPLYILDEQGLRSACRHYREALAQHYPGESLAVFASKAWSCQAVAAIVASEGLGTDVVSGGELQTSLIAGVHPDRIVFHGNNKSRAELEQAIAAGVTVIVDNWLELETLASLTVDRPEPLPVMVRFTPGIECHTHEYIQTGHIDSKFGFDPDRMGAVFEFLSKTPSLTCTGLHAHIGSQIFETQPHIDLPQVMVGWLKMAREYGLPVNTLNVGGGLGIRYTEQDDPPSIDAWIQTVATALQTACQAAGIDDLPRLMCEPGRSLIGSSCITAYTIGSQKDIPGIRHYITVDGGMSDNPRPITYQSLYRAVVANKMSNPASETVTIAGKHCESGDVLIKDAEIASTQPGDILVVMATGAYNYSMASNYNRIARPAAILVNEGEANIIVARETNEDLLRFDRLPTRLQATDA